MSSLRPIIPDSSPSIDPPTPSPPPVPHEHTVRVSALEPERTWKIMDDTLCITTKGQQDIFIPLNSIAKVRLAFEPSRSQRRRFRCYLYNSSTRLATIQNLSYQGLASFSDCSESYVEFLNILIPRIADISPDARFVSGTSCLVWIANALFITVSFSFLLIALFIMASAISGLIILKLALIAFFLPTLFLWFKRNRPSSFSPRSIPESLLPKVHPQI